jgi:hypothetical protein
MTPKRGSDQGYYRHTSPNEMARTASPSPVREFGGRPGSSQGMAIQLAGSDGYGSQRGRNGQDASRQRSKSMADPNRQYTREGRPIMHFGKSMSSAECSKYRARRC